ncbi:interleukin-4 [Arvicanthis niloticus]|uniref:interleukin-4 n=1 Tax=Arvicanthis niloticus TaxID=61156 RepID=UPI001485D1A7|nr:interleukin-4 [Arvicanthis niloticus]
MGLSPQLAVTLLCLLACTGSPTHRRREESRLKEIANSLDQVTKKGTPCTEMLVPDVLTARKNTTENELFCRAYKVLIKFYSQPEKFPCLKNSRSVLTELKKLFRAISSLNPPTSCAMNESMFTTLKDFLESLKHILQKKSWQNRTSVL